MRVNRQRERQIWRNSQMPLTNNRKVLQSPVLNLFCFSFLHFSKAQQPLLDQDLLIIEASRSYSDTPHSLGLLLTSDRPDTGTCTWQHTTLTRDKYPCPSGNRTQTLSKLAAAVPRRRPCGHSIFYRKRFNLTLFYM